MLIENSGIEAVQRIASFKISDLGSIASIDVICIGIKYKGVYDYLKKELQMFTLTY